MWTYLTLRNTLKYNTVLQKIVKGYNISYHRSIRMNPVDVDGANESIVWTNLYSKRAPVVRFKFKVGDRVRNSKQRIVFEKSYLPGWSEEMFTIVRGMGNQRQPMYKLKDYSDEEIKGSIYGQEIQKVHKSDDVYTIEKVLSTRKKKLLGYPSKFNSLVSDLTQ